MFDLDFPSSEAGWPCLMGWKRAASCWGGAPDGRTDHPSLYNSWLYFLSGVPAENKHTLTVLALSRVE